jgi:Zn-dependent peptidase ImmA (M78 family)
MDCAHELAHLVLHRHQDSRKRDVEQEAKIFAGSFLMPRKGVEPTARRQPSLNTVLRDKIRWRISALGYVVRLFRLGMMTEWQYRTLCMQIRKYGDQEPSGVRREQSTLLDKVLSALREDGMSRGSLAEELSITQDDLDSLLQGLVMTGLRGEGAGSGSTEKPTLRLVK